MSRRVLVTAIVAASLVAAPAAAAKEVQQVKLCGASQCFTFDRGNAGGKLALFGEAGPPANAPRRPAGWYELRTRIGGRGMRPVEVRSAYVPSAGLIRVDDEGSGGYAWYVVDGDLTPVLRQAAGRLAPRSPARLHVGDMAPGVPAPRALLTQRDSGAGAAWWMIALGVVAAAAVLLIVRVARHG